VALSFKRYHILMAGALLLAVAAHAQSGRAELFGTIRDAAALPAAGAAAELRDEQTGALYRALSRSDGAYHFSALPPGSYALTIRKTGFAPLRRAGIALGVAARVPLDLTLTVGDVQTAVDVTAAAPLLEATSGATSYLVDGVKIQTLPLDGRNFVPLIALQPGVMLPPGQFLPRINGSRPRTSEYLYDGVSVLQPEPGQVAYYPMLDSIAEFRVQTNSYSAEYGRSNGGVIQVSTKAGTNQWHGSLFEYLRNEAINARNLFAAAGSRPLFRRHLFGATLGGPLRANRTFFFADWQAARLKKGVTRFSTVPTLAERAGIFAAAITDPASGAARTPFPGRTISAERFDPAARGLVARYPEPLIAAAANNYFRSGADTDNTDQFDLRVDHHFNGAHRVFARYSFLRDDARPMPPLPDGSGTPADAAVSSATLTRADSVIGEHTWEVSGSAVNLFRLGYTRRSFDQRPPAPGGLYEIAGLQSLGAPAGTDGRMNTAVIHFIDDYSLTRRGHSLKFGAELRREKLDVLQPPNPRGDYQFTAALTGNSFASFLLGAVQSYSLDAQAGTLEPRAHIAEFFAQDDWRVSPRFTVNAGVRYTLNFPSTEAHDRIAVFNLGTRKLDFPHTARDLEPHNFGPRLGLAWSPSDSLAVRAGYGLVWIEQSGITTPFTAPMFPFIQTVSQASLDNLTPAFQLAGGPRVTVTPPNPDSGLGQGVFGVQRDNGSGYAQQWNLTLLKTFARSWSASLGYAGSKLTRLGVPDTNLNQLPGAQLALGAALTQQVANPFQGLIPATSSLGAPLIARQQLLRRFPEFTTVTLYRNNVGNSTYHALLTHLERRFSRGLTVTASYSFSKLIDDAGAVFNSALLTGPVASYQAADSFNRRLEKDESTGSIPQVFSAGFVWQIRRGWELSGFLRAQSGMLVTVTQSTNFNAAFGYGIQRPNLTANPALPADRRTVARYFNSAAFAPAPQFTLGSASRNPVRGPGYQDADFMLGKIFRLREHVSAELRAEVFNVSNTPPLGQPNGSFGAAAFGTITSAGDPRFFEFAARLKF
jgi:hypothetical protein